jgi:hypothetical protein
MILTGGLCRIWASCGGACWRFRRLRAGQLSAGGWNTKKPLTWPREGSCATRPGAGVANLEETKPE